MALGPWWGDGESTRPTVAFFTVPPQRAEEQNTQFEFVSGVSFTKSEMKYPFCYRILRKTVKKPFYTHSPLHTGSLSLQTGKEALRQVSTGSPRKW